MIGHGTQFITREKLCSFRRWTFVLTVPAFRQANNCSACVSRMTWLRIKLKADSLAARTQRSLVEPSLLSITALKASCQVRVETPASVPARYALAMWRLSCGARNDSLRALSRVVASARSLVPRLSCFRFRNRGRRTCRLFCGDRDGSGFSWLEFFVRACQPETKVRCLNDTKRTANCVSASRARVIAE